MAAKQRFLGAAILFVCALGLALVPQRAASQSPQGTNPPQPAAEESVPAFHAQAPQGELPATLDPGLFPDPVVQNAYAAAAKIKKALYQQPCYCHCDRSQGHKSLLDCFASKHGAGCGTCIYEDFYTLRAVRQREERRADTGRNYQGRVEIGGRDQIQTTPASKLSSVK